MNNLQREFLNGLTTPLGYGYIEPDEVVDICVDNDITFANFVEAVDWLDEPEMEAIATVYAEDCDDKDAKEFIATDEMSDMDTQLEHWSRERL